MQMFIDLNDKYKQINSLAFQSKYLISFYQFLFNYFDVYIIILQVNIKILFSLNYLFVATIT